MDNQLHSAIHESGNSDVDVSVHIDTASLAYMYACSLYATEQINEQQFNHMLRKYHTLMSNRKHDDVIDVRTPVKKLGPPKRLVR